MRAEVRDRRLAVSRCTQGASWPLQARLREGVAVVDMLHVVLLLVATTFACSSSRLRFSSARCSLSRRWVLVMRFDELPPADPELVR